MKQKNPPTQILIISIAQIVLMPDFHVGDVNCVLANSVQNMIR